MLYGRNTAEIKARKSGQLHKKPVPSEKMVYLKPTYVVLHAQGLHTTRYWAQHVMQGNRWV